MMASAELGALPDSVSSRKLNGWALLRPVGILLAARLTMFLVFAMAKNLDHQIGQRPIWDGGWYLNAAELGWPHSVPTVDGHAAQSTLAFFPVFPLLIRAVHVVVPVSWGHAGAIAALGSEVAMAVALWVLARDIFGDKVADRSTLLLCFFPGAFIFALTYAEPLLIAFAAICLYALRKRHWEVAGIMAALATATRPNGVALVACCAWEAFGAIRARGEWRSLIALILAPAGIVAWFAYLWATTGSRLAWLHTEQQGWGEQIQPLAFLHLVAADRHHPFLFANEYVPIIGTLAVAIMVLTAIPLRHRIPSVLIVFTGAILTMSLMSKTLGLRPRFVITAFPLIMVLGYRLRETALGLVTAGFAALMAILLVVTVSTLVLTP